MASDLMDRVSSLQDGNAWPSTIELINDLADRITELESAYKQTLEDYAAAVEAREALAVEAKAKDALIAGLVKALEWVEYCDGLGTFRKRDGREVVVSFEDSDEGMKFFETISDFIDNARKSLAKAKESRDGIL